jgi:hypothetical protein
MALLPLGIMELEEDSQATYNIPTTPEIGNYLSEQLREKDGLSGN